MTLTTKFLTLIKILVCLVLVIQIGHVKCGDDNANGGESATAESTTGDGQTSTNVAATVSSSVRIGQFYFGLFSLVTSLILAKIMD